MPSHQPVVSVHAVVPKVSEKGQQEQQLSEN
jgi:hypothetical protein